MQNNIFGDEIITIHGRTYNLTELKAYADKKIKELLVKKKKST